MNRYEGLRNAIDVVTAWATDGPNGTAFPGERIAEYVGEKPDGEAQLMFGLVSLAGYILTRLEEATGESMQWHLQEIAKVVIDK
ncbi:hypothetical protein P5V19_16855 [Mycobacteroides abscessus subsp. abscessus]|uniref:hypothetical protein n=1 Tax=Mycobacteroides abscessus TaxID=36809 RepID=UPI00265AE0B0|nr:hypothetical protein [Mycobacteroides abscessus]MDO3074761.1 hypothetical protein [Mycobacteroides abscessus subsp. abscessus]MDO3288258.1 hypothetical protein [Mycobacteroides abscessus subsp. abscessus]MDO3296545.1 hypothetical protein [Mycobacteroides abscessus subsp. abscessus]WKE39730.1 hypothetical protein P3M62_01635 [Mycobacteroides abscessus subsp. abscessus]